MAWLAARYFFFVFLFVAGVCAAMAQTQFPVTLKVPPAVSFTTA